MIKSGKKEVGNKETGITLIALIVTIIVNFISYDKNIKNKNLLGFSL